MTSITRERMEQAIEFLGETDEVVAGLKTDMLRAEYVLKRKEAAAFMSGEGPVAERQSRAKLVPDVVAAYNAHTDAMEQYEIIAAKRKTEALIVEVFRTVEASRRQGQ
jgi:hypothetical protein